MSLWSDDNSPFEFHLQYIMKWSSQELVFSFQLKRGSPINRYRSVNVISGDRPPTDPLQTPSVDHSSSVYTTIYGMLRTVSGGGVS